MIYPPQKAFPLPGMSVVFANTDAIGTEVVKFRFLPPSSRGDDMGGISVLGSASCCLQVWSAQIILFQKMLLPKMLTQLITQVHDVEFSYSGVKLRTSD